MVNHLSTCALQETEVVSQARAEKSTAGQKKSHVIVDIPGYGNATSPKVVGRRYTHGNNFSIPEDQQTPVFPAPGTSTTTFRVASNHQMPNPPTSNHIIPNGTTVMVNNEIRGRLALITGGTGGIGRATATLLAKSGCHIALHYHHAASKASDIVNDLTASYGVRCSAFQADFGDFDQVKKLYADVALTMGNPDILYNNSGIVHKIIGFQGSIEDVTMEMFEETWKINTASHFLLTQLCMPHMLEKHFGRIVFCTSVAAHTGGVVGPHYASSKSAMHGLVHWIATRYAKEGITCNAVAPALVTETGMLPDEPPSYVGKIPVGRLGRPQEIAAIVEMLVKNSYMSSKIIVADGGWTSSAF
jgi:3-oxoacyl-[acyl-carrier protein] reductase